ncbi:hypothetical protein ANN_04821 [Periplaneta americana]|uniref:Uncharacterized protein n=1 Tax=Periplaneta americana TaxID=6978 RepID=A0ABQ8T9G2_PERAM|nr:hypothetical protein ANN_04821 [Periplaneta americana]
MVKDDEWKDVLCRGIERRYMYRVRADEPREFNLPTLPERRITYVPEKLPSKYGVHSEEYLPIRTLLSISFTPAIIHKMKQVDKFLLLLRYAYRSDVRCCIYTVQFSMRVCMQSGKNIEGTKIKTLVQLICMKVLIDIIAIKNNSAYILDPTIRFETLADQPHEVDSEKKRIYEPTIPFYKDKYSLSHIDVIGLMVGARGNKISLATFFCIAIQVENNEYIGQWEFSQRTFRPISFVYNAYRPIRHFVHLDVSSIETFRPTSFIHSAYRPEMVEIIYMSKGKPMILLHSFCFHNTVEGWHSTIQKLMVVYHPSAWKFIEVLKNEEHMNEQTILQLHGGHIQLCSSCNKYIQNQERIEEMVRNYRDYNEHNRVEDYLRGLGYRVVINPAEHDSDSEDEY